MSFGGMRRSPRHTLGTSISAAVTRHMRHHTSGSAGSVIIFPRMAVKPHSSTQKWICNWARAVGETGMGAQCSCGLVAGDDRWSR